MPEGKLATELASLLEAAENLNTLSERLNKTLTAVEQALVKANIGFEVWLSDEPLSTSKPKRLSSDGDETESETVELGFAKLHDGWHLAARDIRVVEGPGDYGITEVKSETLEVGPYPLAQASRQERIAALRLLSKLRHKLQTAVQQASAAIIDAEKVIFC